MIIRKATAKDLDKIIDLGQDLQNDSKKFEPLLIFDRGQSLAHYKNELSNDGALIIVAENNGKIIGYQYSFTNELDYLSKKNKECTLEAIYVIPEYRSRGIGGKLMEFAENWAINTCHVNRIKANIYTDNESSIALHVNNGFKPYCSEYLKIINSNE